MKIKDPQITFSSSSCNCRTRCCSSWRLCCSLSNSSIVGASYRVCRNQACHCTDCSFRQCLQEKNTIYMETCLATCSLQRDLYHRLSFVPNASIDHLTENVNSREIQVSPVTDRTRVVRIRHFPVLVSVEIPADHDMFLPRKPVCLV